MSTTSAYHSHVDELKRCLKNEQADLKHAFIERVVVSEWRQHFHAYVWAGEGHFEHMMWNDVINTRLTILEAITAVFVAIQWFIKMYI